ncbi:hypothetical protein GCM10025864_15220 [Luteimicrobium album]|uniref:Uncharacterized protein n=1 Tax=Luteimicrobium album TaxID=1054550 RepID=A0ABQ6I0S2_9MICO|nr:hypothetical protein GCM10025864_15220 [Luteimicrobium album]
MSRRLLTMVAGGCGLVLGCVIVIVLALTVGVPSSVADRPTSKDDRVPVTAPVTQTTIEQTQVLTGSLTPASRTDVVADSGIVTAMPVKDGAAVKGGHVIADVNDEPVLALEMPFALWRDLDVGATGADARAVQDGLKKAGLFDGSTTAALSQSTFDALGRADSRLRKPRSASPASLPSTGRGLVCRLPACRSGSESMEIMRSRSRGAAMSSPWAMAVQRPEPSTRARSCAYRATTVRPTGRAP